MYYNLYNDEITHSATDCDLTELSMLDKIYSNYNSLWKKPYELYELKDLLLVFYEEDALDKLTPVIKTKYIRGLRMIKENNVDGISRRELAFQIYYELLPSPFPSKN